MGIQSDARWISRGQWHVASDLPISPWLLLVSPCFSLNDGGSRDHQREAVGIGSPIWFSDGVGT